MTKKTSSSRVIEIEARIYRLEKKIDALLSIIMQEISADFEGDDESEVFELPDAIKGHTVFDFKHDSQFN